MKEKKRWQGKAVEYALKVRRVVILGGARQTGKTTLAKQVAESLTNPNDATYRTLDDDKFLEHAREDPQSFLSHDKSLMIIDEIQKAPHLIPAIKMIVDDNPRPGQFLLTGSADIQTLPTVTESLAGRVRHVRLHPFTRGEILSKDPAFLSRARTLDFPSDLPIMSRRDLLDLAFRGGFPEVIDVPQSQRHQWHRDYINTLILRDLSDFANVRRQDVLRKLLDFLAGWSSKLLDMQEIASSLGISTETLRHYSSVLRMMYIVDYLPPWTATDYDRVRRKDKFFIGDSGLMASLLKWNIDAIEFDSDRVGKLIETLVFNELSAQICANDDEFYLYYYRDRLQREIDFIVECPNGDLIGIEVKTGSNFCKDDFKHLHWFADNIAKGRKFTGIVLYNGQHTMRFGENFAAVPLQCLWG